MKESSNNHKAVNSLGYLGLYQMGEASLVDTKYIDKWTKKWTGNWTGQHGIKSKEDFLNDRHVQEIAIREYHQLIWKYLKPVQKYEGMVIKNIKLSKAGMIACGHLVGHTAAKHFIESNGTIDEEDGNLIPCSQYLEGFSPYEDVDFTIEGYLKSLPTQEAKRFSSLDPFELDKELEKMFLNDPQKLLITHNPQKIHDDLEKKLQTLLSKFVDKEKKKLGEEIQSTMADYQNEIETYHQTLQAQVDSEKTRLKAEGEQYCAMVLQERLKQAKMLAKPGEQSIVSNADVAEKKTIEVRQIIQDMANKAEQDLATKQQTLAQEYNKKIANKQKEANANISTVQNNLQAALVQIFQQLNEEARKPVQNSP